jgi:hypothetical protein
MRGEILVQATEVDVDSKVNVFIRPEVRPCEKRVLLL